MLKNSGNPGQMFRLLDIVHRLRTDGLGQIVLTTWQAGSVATEDSQNPWQCSESAGSAGKGYTQQRHRPHKRGIALAGMWLSWASSRALKGFGSIPGQGTGPGSGLGPQYGARRRQLIDVSRSHQCFSLYLSFPLSLKISEKGEGLIDDGRRLDLGW